MKLYIFYIDGANAELFSNLFNDFFSSYLKAPDTVSSVVTTADQLSYLNKIANFTNFFNPTDETLQIVAEHHAINEKIVPADIKTAIQQAITKNSDQNFSEIVIVFNPGVVIKNLTIDGFNTNNVPLQIKNYFKFKFYLVANKLAKGSNLFILDASLISNEKDFYAFSRAIIENGDDIMVVSDSDYKSKKLKTGYRQLDVYRVPDNKYIFQVIVLLLVSLEQQNNAIEKQNVFILTEAEQYSYLTEIHHHYSLLSYTVNDLKSLMRFYFEKISSEQMPGLVEDVENGSQENNHKDIITNAVIRVNNINAEKRKGATGWRKWLYAALNNLKSFGSKVFSMVPAVQTALYAGLRYTGGKSPKDLNLDLLRKMTVWQSIKSGGAFTISLGINYPINKDNIGPSFQRLYGALHDLVTKRKMAPEMRFALLLSTFVTVTLLPVAWDSLEAERDAEEKSIVAKFFINFLIPILFTASSEMVTFATRFPAAISAYLRLFNEDAKTLRKVSVDFARMGNDPRLKNIRVKMQGKRGRKSIEVAVKEFVHALLDEMDKKGIQIPGMSKTEFAGELSKGFMAILGLNTWLMWLEKARRGLELLAALFGSDLQNSKLWKEGLYIPVSLLMSSGNALFYVLHHHDFGPKALHFLKQLHREIKGEIKFRPIDFTKPWAGVPLGFSGPAVQELVQELIASNVITYAWLVKNLLSGTWWEVMANLSAVLVNSSLILNRLMLDEKSLVRDYLDLNHFIYVTNQGKYTGLIPKGLSAEMKRHGFFQNQEGPLKNGYIALTNNGHTNGVKKDYGTSGITDTNVEEDGIQMQTLFYGKS